MQIEEQFDPFLISGIIKDPTTRISDVHPIKPPGKFIVFEGIDGCGKSTQVGKLASFISNILGDHDVHTTKEPTIKNKEIREKMRNIHINENIAMWYTKAFVMDRRDHLVDFIGPSLLKGSHVICDRFKYSTFAYQHTLGVPIEEIITMHIKKYANWVPDIVFILDCPVEVSQKRMRERRGGLDSFENNTPFQRKVRENYLKMKDIFPEERIVFVDGNRPVKEVSKEIEKHIIKLISS